MIDLRYIKKLVDMLDGSTVDSIEISSDKGMKIRISKTPTQRGPLPVVAPMPMSVAPPLTAGAAAPADGGSPSPKGEAAKPNYLEVKSPMVGTFYTAPEPGTKPYVGVGDRIAKGEILCIIEAMKIMNEIESEFDGIVKEVLVDNAQPVEYAQVLFRIDPNG